MRTNRPAAHQSELFSALLPAAFGHDLDPADLEKLPVPGGHTRAGWEKKLRDVAEQAREAFDDGRHADARRVILETAQEYADVARPVAMPGPRTDDLGPDELADLIRNR